LISDGRDKELYGAITEIRRTNGSLPALWKIIAKIYFSHWEVEA
jgi:hypothetical protein